MGERMLLPLCWMKLSEARHSQFETVTIQATRELVLGAE